jgi:UDPglucose 6-dehydrogenase
MPGFLSKNVQPTLERILGDLGFELAYKPEFIALGTVIRDLLYPDVILVGAKTEETAQKVENIYREVVLHDCQAKKISLVEAELAKISLNCAITMKISFSAQVAMIARRLGADPLKVLSAVGHDHRVGHGALKPGLPYGGPCFPRDNRMFQAVATSVGERAPLAEATDVVNKNLMRWIVNQVPAHGTVGILGLAYKPGTTITEESAGSYFYKVLKSRSRRVYAYDPMALHPNTLEEVLGCDFILIGCSCSEFREITIHPNTKIFDVTGEVKVSYSTDVKKTREREDGDSRKILAHHDAHA